METVTRLAVRFSVPRCTDCGEWVAMAHDQHGNRYEEADVHGYGPEEVAAGVEAAKVDAFAQVDRHAVILDIRRANKWCGDRPARLRTRALEDMPTATLLTLVGMLQR